MKSVFKENGEEILLAIAIVQPTTPEELEGRQKLIDYLTNSGFRYQANSKTHHVFSAPNTPSMQLVAASVACKERELDPAAYKPQPDMSLTPEVPGPLGSKGAWY